MNIHRFLRDWSLPIAMVGGALSYLLYVNIPFFDSTHIFVSNVVAFLQPTLIFLMLFVTFCKIKINDLRVERWHIILLLFQILLFIALSLIVALVPSLPFALRLMLEAAMLCLLCPTATAAAVITAKLGGNAASLISYTMLINISVALVAPLFLTLSNPVAGLSFFSSFVLIMGKIFPLLLCPLLVAELVRRYMPAFHRFIVQKGRNIPFYLWLIALSIAIAMTTRAIVHSNISLLAMMGIAAVSLFCCVVQFLYGWFVGRRYGERVTGGQALGQKNTVFAIWLAYTFMTPVTAIAGGFYSVWHNIINTWQLYNKNHKE